MTVNFVSVYVIRIIRSKISDFWLVHSNLITLESLLLRISPIILGRSQPWSPRNLPIPKPTTIGNFSNEYQTNTFEPPHIQLVADSKYDFLVFLLLWRMFAWFCRLCLCFPICWSTVGRWLPIYTFFGSQCPNVSKNHRVDIQRLFHLNKHLLMMRIEWVSCLIWGFISFLSNNEVPWFQIRRPTSSTTSISLIFLNMFIFYLYVDEDHFCDSLNQKTKLIWFLRKFWVQLWTH